MMRTLTIDPDDFTPPYEQLRRQIAAYVAAGELAAGDRLPPVRQLARDLGIAPGTVARAYSELEAQAVVTTSRAGTVVASAARSRDECERHGQELAAAFVAAMRRLGLGDDDIRGQIGRLLG